MLIASLLVLNVITYASAQDNELTSKEKKAGWKQLFDGKTSMQRS